MSQWKWETLERRNDEVKEQWNGETKDRWNGTNRRMVGSYLTTCLYLSCYLKLKIAYFFLFLGLISEYTQIRKGVRPAENRLRNKSLNCQRQKSFRQ